MSSSNPAPAAPAPQSEATQLLGAIPFGHLIGAPLTAAVEAQAKAAQSTLTFIEAVALGQDGNVRTIAFKFKKTKDDGTTENASLTVPILTILPVPYIRIDDMTIDFKASISASTDSEEKTADETTAKASLSASAKYLWFSAKFDASVSSKKDSSSTRSSKYAVEYTIDIHVHAVQDDIPKGLATVLQILNESIQAKQPA